ncbi:carbohydrate ABC transporter permease [Streptomyces sp. NPDC026672]|uniref:carbohydrate ABC transporter permease n=1 Tax=unclassified Streptomyces TaxID=2593676 RepID=UPI0033F3AFB5
MTATTATTASAPAPSRTDRRRTATRPPWQGEPKRATSAGKAVALTLAVLAVLVPFWAVLATSLSPDAQVIRNGGWSLWPEHISLHAYRQILSGGTVTHAMLVSTGVTVVGTALSLLATTTLAYALARPGVFGGKPVLLGCMIAFLFPPGIIPSWLLVHGLHLTDTDWALILPVLISVFNLVVMRGFFQGIPGELYEAARLDGAGELQVLFRIVLPLSRSIVAVVGFFYAVTYWNNFFNGMLYIAPSTGKWPLQTVLQLYVSAGASSDAAAGSEAAVHMAPQTQEMAMVVIAVLPILIAFPFLQRFFTKGVLVGAVKS